MTRRNQAELENNEGKKLARAISDALNTFGYSQIIDATVAEMAHEHRTLQQCFSQLCLDWFRQLAKDPDCCDARNEASVKLAVKVVEVIGKEGRLPFI